MQDQSTSGIAVLATPEHFSYMHIRIPKTPTTPPLCKEHSETEKCARNIQKMIGDVLKSKMAGKKKRVNGRRSYSVPGSARAKTPHQAPSVAHDNCSLFAVASPCTRERFLYWDGSTHAQLRRSGLVGLSSSSEFGLKEVDAKKTPGAFIRSSGLILIPTLISSPMAFSESVLPIFPHQRFATNRNPLPGFQLRKSTLHRRRRTRRGGLWKLHLCQSMLRSHSTSIHSQ